MVIEVWKDFNEVNGLYQVSNTGKVRSALSGKEIKSFVSRIGYHDCYLYLGEKPKKRMIRKLHRMVALTFLENPNNLKEVNHIDGNKNNNCVSNLEWVSRSVNIKHSFDLGLSKPRLGQDNNKTKLTEEQVREIRELRKTLKLREIANIYKITLANVSEICNNKTWRHLT